MAGHAREARTRPGKEPGFANHPSQILCFFARAPRDCTRARRTTDAPEESGPAAMAQQAIYEQMVFPTRFVWAHGGKQVRPARIATFVGFSATRV